METNRQDYSGFLRAARASLIHSGGLGALEDCTLFPSDRAGLAGFLRARYGSVGLRLVESGRSWEHWCFSGGGIVWNVCACFEG